MLKTKRCFLIPLSLFLAIVLSGCFPSGEISTPSDEKPEDIESTIMQINTENDNLIIDVDLPENIPEKVEKLKVRWKSWNYERLDDLFIRGVDGLELIQDEKNEDGSLDWRWYLSEAGDSVTYGSLGRLWVEAGEPYKSYNYFALSEGAWATTPLEDYFTEDSISLFARGDALEKAKKTLSDAGINNLGEPLVYALIADKANTYLNEKYKDLLDKEDNPMVIPTWTAENEAYVFEFGQEFNGVPLSRYSVPGALSGTADDSETTHITMVVGKDVNPLIWCEGIIDEDYEIVGEAPVAVSPQSALKTVAERYAGLSIPNQITKICGCRLVYAPSEQAEDGCLILNPFWEFDIRYDRGRELETVSATYINAQTGMGV